MPLVPKKIVTIISDQCDNLEERCKGYREEIFTTIAEIFDLERMHRIKATNIQQKINDKCDATGRFLAENVTPNK